MNETPESIADALVRLALNLRADGYRFTTITPRSHAIVNMRPENTWARTARDVFGWSRPFREGTLAPPLVEAMREADILETLPGGFRSRLRLSSLDDALFFHSAFPTTARDAVFFGPDTAKFADAIVHHLEGRRGEVRRAVDVCAGAGPGGIVIAKRAPDAEVFLADINERALALAAVNARLAACANIRPRHSDLLDGVDGRFDLVVAHPPYLIDRGARAYRHGGGVLGAELSLAVVRAALPRLQPGGTLLLFTGVAMMDGEDPFLAALRPILEENDARWRLREVDPDVFGEELEAAPYDRAERIALVVLEATRDGPA